MCHHKQLDDLDGTMIVVRVLSRTRLEAQANRYCTFTIPEVQGTPDIGDINWSKAAYLSSSST